MAVETQKRTVFRSRDRAILLAKIGLSAAVLTVLLRRVDASRIVEAVAEVSLGWVSAALALYVAGQLVSALKWSRLAEAVGFRRRYRDYAAFYFIGMFVNLLGPSTVGGDVTRSLLLGNGKRRALALNSVVFDRVSGLFMLVVIGLGALWAFPQPGIPAELSAAAAAILVLLLGFWWLLPRLAAVALPAGHRLRNFVSRDLAPFWKGRDLLVVALSLSAAFHLVEVTAQYALARALGLSVPFSFCLILHPAVAVLSALPISVAGLGVRESGYLFFLELIGVPGAEAVAFGLLWFAMAVVGALPGGMILFLRKTTARARESS